MKRLVEMIAEARELGASDLHLTVGVPPIIRVNGEILTLPGFDQLKPHDVEELMEPMLDAEQKAIFNDQWMLCFSRSLSNLGYFRVSLYRRANAMEASIRLGMQEIPTFEELGLPAVVEEMARRPYGLVLITGSTGSGKTTTFNSMLDLINRERKAKVITIEDPIEFVHHPVQSLMVQQEVGSDVKSFHQALIHALRQDPNVIGVGELREVETIATALMAAETGHLVLATLHTNDAVSTINRIVDVFPVHQQAQVRYQLSSTLQGIINQRLLPRLDKQGRVLACEILIANDAVRALIRENKHHQLENVIATGSKFGMQALENELQNLYDQGVISYDVFTSFKPRRLAQGTHKEGGH